MTAIITGGTKGIGRAIVEKLAGEGMDVITCSRSAENLDALQASARQQFPKASVTTFQADLSKKEDTLAFADFVKQQTDTVDMLVNNTGIFIPGEVHTEAEGALESMIAANLYSAYHLTRALIDPVIRARGHIFTICSTASIMPYVNGGSYCISKYALYGMTKVLREEMKDKGVRVTAILPGATLTASWEGTDLPHDRFMKPEDVAESLYSAYKLSPNSVVEELLIRPQLGDL